jgi:inosine-uridine nucleoside N-ribohydrolase
MRDVVTRIVFDVDTGIDDAPALLYAVANPELDLGALTCVSGQCRAPACRAEHLLRSRSS